MYLSLNEMKIAPVASNEVSVDLGGKVSRINMDLVLPRKKS